MLPQTILAPGPVRTTVELAPVHNALASLAALSAAEEHPGLSDWASRQASLLDSEGRRRNLVLLQGLGLDALASAVPVAPTDRFPDYLAALGDAAAQPLRDRLLEGALRSPRLALLRDVPELVLPSPASVLADPDALAVLFRARGGDKDLPEEQLDVLRELHALLLDPPALQAALVEHLGHLWRTHLCTEWEEIEPRLIEAAAALATIDTRELTLLEAIRAVAGRELDGIFRPERVAEIRHLRLIPSLHTGPYTIWFVDGGEMCLVFGARAPAAQRGALPELDRAELLHRLKAIADDARLSILVALAHEGELPTATIQERFGLSSSAASRHLRQLVATGLITERRDEGAAKRYRLAGDGVRATVRRLGEVLGGQAG